MLSQLLMAQGRFADALSALQSTPQPDGERPYPDIAAKMGVCFVRLGQLDDGVRSFALLLKESAPAFHDLFVEVRL
jgi:hypothetical protein